MPRLYPVAFGLAAVALAASLAANVCLVTRPHLPRRVVVAAGPTSGGPESGAASASSCVTDLEACRRASAKLVSWGIAIGAASASPSPPSGARQQPEVPPEDRLCEIARDKLREQWQEKEEAIGHEIAKMLADPAQQEREARRDAATAADAVGATGRARSDFEDAFVDTRVRVLTSLLPLAQEGYMDWPGLLDGAKLLFEAEGGVVEAHLGGDAAVRYQAAEKSTRLTILTALATYAGADWDEATSMP
jgi:hypothetical protein